MVYSQGSDIQEEIEMLELPVVVEKSKISMIVQYKQSANNAPIEIDGIKYGERALMFLGLFARFEPTIRKYTGVMKFQDIEKGAPVSNTADFNTLFGHVNEKLTES